MRFIGFAVVLMLVVSQSGCRWTQGFKSVNLKTNIEPVFLPNTSSVEIIDRLNANTSRIRSWQSENTVVKVKGPGLPMAVSLKAAIAVEAPRNFRIRAQSTMANADMGSNNQGMWFWAKPGTDNVMIASHADVPMIQRHANLPFDPVWLMEVLGVVPLERSQVELHAEPDPRSNYSSLVFDRIAPDGKHYRRIVTIDNRFGTISEHRLIDRDNKTIVARATLSNYKIVDGATIPHTIGLEWPLTKTEFALKLRDVAVNVPIDEDQWTVPEMDNYPPIDLGAQVALQLGLEHRGAAPPEPPPFADGDGRQSLEDVRERLLNPTRVAEAPAWDDEPSARGNLQKNPFE